jgi:phosphatidylserine/phosphatidylglycerophosphate/cardiolipin synthase-like enzyme
MRFKRSGAPLMHLKSYQIDGRWLRTGAANFSASGLKRQDNDLLVIDSQPRRRCLSGVSKRSSRKEKPWPLASRKEKPCLCRDGADPVNGANWVPLRLKIDRVQAIDILGWRNGFDQAARIEPAGQRQLQQDSMDGGIALSCSTKASSSASLVVAARSCWTE